MDYRIRLPISKHADPMVIQAQALRKRGISHCGHLCTLKKKTLHRLEQNFLVLDIYFTAKTMGFRCAIKNPKPKQNTCIS